MNEELHNILFGFQFQTGDFADLSDDEGTPESILARDLAVERITALFNKE